MARLSVSFTLCPLIDQKSLLGVSEDSQHDHVIVTLGKNMVVRYKVKDQKQISSWSSTLKFTSPVIFDGESKRYASVLDQNLIRLWESGDQTLDKVKKYKFGKEIHCLLAQSGDEPSLVVFRDGTFSPLSEALENRKAEGNKPHLAMKDCKIVTEHGKKYITYLTSTPSETSFHTVAVDNGKETTFPLARDSLELRAHAVMEEDGKCVLYTLWSDGQLFHLRLLAGPAPAAPGAALHTLSELSLKHGAAMTALGPAHLAVYGADASEEGAALLVFNTQFCFVQARQLSKLFGAAPRLWHFARNLFLASGNFLTVVPYRLDVARLAAVVGSRAPPPDKIARAAWGSAPAAAERAAPPASIARHLKSLAGLGWPQATVAAKLLPKLAEDKDYAAAAWLVRNHADVDEETVVSLLRTCLAEEDAAFDAAGGKRGFLDAVLGCRCGEVALLPPLRGLSLSDTLALLAHLAERMAAAAVEGPSLADWMCVLLDAHYQELLLSEDALALTTLTAVRNAVEGEIRDVDNLKALQPLLRRLSLGKSVVQTAAEGSDYSIEDVRFDW